AYGVQVVGNLAYVADYHFGLQVLEVSDPGNIRWLGGYDSIGYAWSVQVVGNLAYLADGDAGLQVLEVTDPVNVQRLGGFDTSGYAYNMHVVGNLGFVADGSGGILVIQLSGGPGFVPGLFSEPTDQFALSGGSVTFQIAAAGDEPLHYQWRKDGQDLVEGGRISGVATPVLTINLVEAGDQGAYSVVVSNAAGSVISRPARLSTQPPEITGQPQDLALVENVPAVFWVTATGLGLNYQWRKDGQDLGDGGRIRGATTSTLTILLPEAADEGSYSVVVSNTTGSVVSRAAVLTVLYVTGQLLGGYDTGGTALRVQVVGSLACVADGAAGLQILDVSNPANIRRLGGFATGGSAWSVQAVGNVAYVGDYSGGLQVLDVSNPANIRLLGSYNLYWLQNDLQVAGNLAYVATYDNGFRAFDVSDPAYIRYLGGYRTRPEFVVPSAFWGMQLVGNLAYVTGPRGGLEVLDVSNPANIRLLGSYSTSGRAYGVQVVGNLAYVANGAPGLIVLDVSNPASIRPVDGFDTAGTAYRVQVMGSLAYVADGTNGLRVLDVSNPTDLRQLGGFDTRGVARAVQVVGNRAYVADSDAGLQVILLSGGPGFMPGLLQEPVDQSAPLGGSATFQVSAAGTEPLHYQWRKDGQDLVDGGRISGATASALTIYPVEATDQGAYSVVVTNAAGSVTSQPARLSTPPPEITGQPEDLAVVENLTAKFRVTATGLGLSYQWRKNGQDLVDGGRISGATTPVLTIQAVLAADQATYSVVVSNAAGSVTSSGARLTLLEPVTGQLLGSYSTSGRLQVVGNLAYVADGAGLQVLDVSDPANIRRLGGFAKAWSAQGVHVVGNRAYVAAVLMGLDVFDVSDPGNIRRLGGRLGGFVTGGLAYDVQAVGNRAYVADYAFDLQVLDVSDPANIRLLGGFATSGHAVSVQVVGNLAYVAEHPADLSLPRGLQILDVSNPANIRRLGGFDISRTSQAAYDVQVVGNLAYLTDSDFGLLVLDVSDPSSVRQVGGYRTSGRAYSVQVIGNLAYVATGTSGLQVLDVSDPANIGRLGGYDTSGIASSVQVVGNLAYVADGSGGLQVIRLSGGPGFMPGLFLEPAGQYAPLGGSVTFRVAAAGDEPLHYQWRKDGQDLMNGGRISGATTSVLTINPVQAADQGSYSVMVRNAAGSVESRAAVLTYATHLTIRLAEGRTSLTLLAPAGLQLEVQYTDRLSAPTTWQPLTNVTAGATQVVVEDPNPSAGAQRFYRAVEKPVP
ncbi:MAG: immunoglobulin domain-containing protein, partial [Chloroflexi bacterium]|nr:immunoglobulin domain-containing protein [Chloroflexota bacterium]